ncbi:GntR family transcriptional regulator [Streptomyces sp. NPDC047081]|uniref:GntR family transcriptional regulator n=1 Tax=Streptomyces sp. NPDC047081 TaxID=3154706 RepID=UPI00340E73A1
MVFDMQKNAPTTRGEAVFTAVRGDILAGRLTPGARMPFADLCARYGASTGVLREALSRLAEQGLVLVEPQQGYRVMPLSAEDLADLTAARVEIEGLVLRQAVIQGDLGWESQVIARHHALTRTPQVDATDPARFSDDWTRAHAQFHATVLEGCTNRRLRAIANGLRDSAELYRQWSRPLGHDEDRDIAGEHRALMQAVLARDADAAVAVLTAHIEHTSVVLLDRAAQAEHPG